MCLTSTIEERVEDTRREIEKARLRISQDQSEIQKYEIKLAAWEEVLELEQLKTVKKIVPARKVFVKKMAKKKEVKQKPLQLVPKSSSLLSVIRRNDQNAKLTFGMIIEAYRRVSGDSEGLSYKSLHAAINSRITNPSRRVHLTTLMTKIKVAVNSACPEVSNLFFLDYSKELVKVHLNESAADAFSKAS